MIDRRGGDALYRVVVEADPNLVFIADSEGRIVRVNSRWIEYTGVTPDEISADRGAPLNIVHPDDLDATWKSWLHALQTGQPFEISYRLRSVRDGRHRWFLARAVPNRDDNGTILGWFGVATDIDSQVRATQRARFLSDASGALSSSLDRDDVRRALARVALERFADGCVIIERDEEGALRRSVIAHRDPHIEAGAREKSARTPVTTSSHSAHVIESKHSLLIPDVDDPERGGWKNAEGVTFARIIEPLRSMITVPLIVADRAVGSISFVSSGSVPAYDEFDLETAEAVARQAATAFEHAASFAREREAMERARYLAHATDQLFSTRDFNQDLETFLQSLVGHWAHRALLFSFGPENSVRVHAVADSSSTTQPAAEEFRGERIFLPEAEVQFRELIARHASWMRTDVTLESMTTNIQPYLHHVVEKISPQSLLVVPLYTADYDFGALGVYLNDRNFNETDREMFEEIGRRLSLAIEHMQSISRERRLAQTLQELTLPPVLPSVPGAVLSTAYAPATISDAPVGGDWYDAFQLPDGRTVLTIGDVTGSGLQASAIMGKLRHAINSIALYEPDPARVLDAAEYVLLQRYPDAVATAFIAILDAEQTNIVYANAGHPHPVLRLWDSSLEYLEAEGLPIGSRVLLTAAESRTRRIDDVAMMAFYTDGITEATRNLIEGEKRLFDAFATEGILYVRAPAALLADSCIPEGPHDDDAALMVLSFPRSLGWSFEAENAKAAQTARGSFVERLAAEATLESDLAAAEIVFGELVGNVVRQAPGSIDVALEWRAGRAVLHVVDRGPGFEYTLPAEIDLLSESGRGLWLAHQFGEQVTVERLPRFGAHVSVMLPVFRAEPSAKVTAATRKRAKTRASAPRSATTK